MKKNPYQAPDSDLSVDTVQMPKTIWWKVFFFFSCLLTLLVIAGIVFAETIPASLLEFLDFTISIIGFVGLFGLAFNRAIGRQNFWKYFFYFNILVSIVVFVFFPIAGIEMYGQPVELNAEYAFALAYGLIFIWGLYLYGFKRPLIWGR